MKYTVKKHKRHLQEQYQISVKIITEELSKEQKKDMGPSKHLQQDKKHS